MKMLNRALISIYATQELLDLVKRLKPSLHRWTLKEINCNPTVYMVETEDQNRRGVQLEKYYKIIVEKEFLELGITRKDWPDEIANDLFSQWSFSIFSRWFSYQYHELAYDLCEENLETCIE
jgi:hypothetical protein